MKTRILRPRELTDQDRAAWRTFIGEQDALQSPFFLPEFCLAVDEVNAAARVIVVDDADGPAAFLPFQYADHGEPVALGGSLNDYQGLICRADFQPTAGTVLNAAGLTRLFCTKLLDWSAAFRQDVVAVRPSPFIDLSSGYAAWERSLKGTSQLKQLARKERKLIREQGPVRFEFHEASADRLQQLITWKRDQYLRSGEHDVLASGWPPELLKLLLNAPHDSPLQPVLSTLSAGDHLVAAHYGLCSSTIFHCWFPVYNTQFHRYSPGKLLLRYMLFHAPERGLLRFDFGAGDEPYKYTFANSSTDVCRTIVDQNRPRRWLRTKYYRLRMAVKHSGLGPRLKALRTRLRSRPPVESTEPCGARRTQPLSVRSESDSTIELTS